MAVDVKRIIQEMVVPDLQAIKADLATLKVEIKRLDEKIDNVDRRIDSVDKRIDSLRGEFSARMDALDRGLSTAIDIHERLAALEAKVGR